MSVGKSSIKRAAGAGTKKTAKATVKKIVEAEAVIPAVTEEVAEAVAAEETPAAPKPARKRTTAKKTTTKKAAVQAEGEEKKAKAQFVQLKEELPVYLL